MDGSMKAHPSSERISILLDEPWIDMEAQAHLEVCDACRAEFERMSRMRMAMSALGELEAPAGQWAAIEAALDRRGAGGGVSPLRRVAQRLMVSGPLQAAAALALFAGGVVAGLQVTGGGEAVPGRAVATDPPAVLTATGEDRAVYDGLSELESLGGSLRQVGLGGEDVMGNPAAAVEQMLRLEAAIEMMRQRLEADPADPVASAFLLQYDEARASLADELERAARSRLSTKW